MQTNEIFFFVDLFCEWSQDEYKYAEKPLGKAKDNYEGEILKVLKLIILIYEFLIALF